MGRAGRSRALHRVLPSFVGVSLLVVMAAVLGACVGSDEERDAPTSEATQAFAPPGVGASVEVPASWREGNDPFGAGFDFSISDPDGDGAVLAMRAMAYGTDVGTAVAASRAFLTSVDARVTSRETTSIEGRSTAVLGYSFLTSGGGRAVMTEYAVIVGDGTVIRLAVGELEPRSQTEALEAIAESIALGDLSIPVALETLSLDDAGFVGEYRVPEPGPPTRSPGILLLTGYGGGMPPQGIQLARAGYPTLSLAYYNLPTLPGTLTDIPLEYFADALRWLGEQPEVDPERVIVWGYSRGGEAALLLGATYPDLVHGVVANVPSNVVNGSFDIEGAAVWTLEGKALPFNDQFPRTDVVDAPEAEIAVERIAGPVVLVCGARDEQWASCPMSRAIDDRLAEHAHPFPRELLVYPDAGHFVNMPPFSTLADVRSTGDDAWRATLAFLDEAGLGP